MKKESEIQKEIVSWLKRYFFCWRHFNAPMIHGSGHFTKSQTKGAPDIMGILPCGKSLQLEVKRTDKAAKSREQIAWIEKAKASNGIAFFAWSLDMVKDRLAICIKCKGSRFSCQLDDIIDQ